MTFFYDLNKRLSQLAAKQDAKQLTESTAMAEKADYSAKKAAAGQDIGQPGKAFAKIAKSAGKSYGSKSAGERVAGAVLKKLRAKEDIAHEGNEFSGELAKAKSTGAKEFNVDGKTYPVKEASKPMTPKQKSFAKLAPPTDKITFADKIAGAKQEVDEMLGDVAAEAMKKAIAGQTAEVDEGFAEMDAWLKQREKEKGTGKFDKRKISTGTVYTRKMDDEESDATDDEGNKIVRGRGRPKGKDKGPERVTSKSYKYKSGRPAKTAEDLDTDGVMMTRPSNMSSEGIDPSERSEYDQEGESAKHDIKTIVRHAQALHKILGDDDNLPEWVQSKLAKIEGMMIAVDEYMQNQDGDEEPIAEKAKSKAQQKFMGMVHAAQKGEKPASKEVSKVAKSMGKKDAKDFASTKHKGLPNKVKEESTDKEDQKAEKAGKKVAKDIEHDEGHKGKDDNRAEKAGKKVTKDIEYDDKKDKEEKVKESNKGGYNFGGGVYESFNSKVENIITEGMNVSVNMSTGDDGQPTKSINISADGDDADKLAELLKMAGLDSMASEKQTCPQCGSNDCGCTEVVDENSPDWPTNTETSDDAFQYAGGLNKPKSTGQTTIPVVASQLRRQVSMEEGVTLERSLFNTWKNYKAQ
jgi:hypothetical protein